MMVKWEVDGVIIYIQEYVAEDSCHERCRNIPHYQLSVKRVMLGKKECSDLQLLPLEIS